LNPKLIIVPENYEGDIGNDIALIGFEESNLKILDDYYDTLKNNKKPFYFDDKDLNIF